METVAVEQAPVEQAAVEAAPVEAAPVEAAPVDETPYYDPAVVDPMATNGNPIFNDPAAQEALGTTVEEVPAEAESVDDASAGGGQGEAAAAQDDGSQGGDGAAEAEPVAEETYNIFEDPTFNPMLATAEEPVAEAADTGSSNGTGSADGWWRRRRRWRRRWRQRRRCRWHRKRRRSKRPADGSGTVTSDEASAGTEEAATEVAAQSATS